MGDLMKEEQSISLSNEELCEEVSKNSKVSIDEVKKILDAFINLFFKKFKMK